MKRTTDPDVLLLQAAADPTRLAILRRLSTGIPACACELDGGTGVRQPTVSHHLRILRQAGWVTTERRGTWIWYAIRPEAAERFSGIAAGIAPGDGHALPAGALGEGAGLPAGALGAGAGLPAGALGAGASDARGGGHEPAAGVVGGPDAGRIAPVVSRGATRSGG